MLQGFPQTETLQKLRDNLRYEFAQSNVHNTIDERYKIDTAHSTILRFQQSLSQKNKFLLVLEQLRKLDFGILHVKELQLVYNDWYHKEDKTLVLATIYPLPIKMLLSERVSDINSRQYFIVMVVPL